MNEVSVTVVGNVVSEVRSAVTKNGTVVAGFRMVTSERRFDRAIGEWSDGEATYLGVSCWRAMAENVAASVHKGDPVVVHGRLRVRDWEKEGKRGREIEIDAASVGHDLARGTSSFARTARRSAAIEREVLVGLAEGDGLAADGLAGDGLVGGDRPDGRDRPVGVRGGGLTAVPWADEVTGDAAASPAA